MGDTDETLLGEVARVVFLLLMCSLKRWNDLTRRKEDITLFGEVVGEDDDAMLLVIECGMEQVDDDAGIVDRLLAVELLLLFIMEAIDSLVRNLPFFLCCCNGAISSS